ncbi:MAG TPA: ribonuclease HII [Candidatus Colwellbacteria bacterium]|nr:ribonuclease HII [Candidatus Colwellbacteria bacterium]
MKQYIIGIDEVGRGPLAGPVCVAACLLPAEFKIKSGPSKLKDSKRLSAAKRKEWCDWLCRESAKREEGMFLIYATSRVYPRRIDKTNISRAANAAALKSCQKVLDELGRISPKKAEARVYLDGGLYLQSRSKQEALVGRGFGRTFIKSIKTIVAGDEKFAAVKLASIVAKVSRDKYMDLEHKKYPEYDFAKHKGYGTKEHLEAIRKAGPCPIHRLTFLKKYRNIKPEKSPFSGQYQTQ